MNWFYAVDGNQVGPVADAEWENLVKAGTIRGETLVWHEGMPAWRPYREVGAPAAATEFAGSTGAALELRPMGIGDILDRTFRLYRTHFMPFFLLMLSIQAVAYLCTLAWQATFWSSLQTMGRPGLAMMGSAAMFFPVIIIVILFTQIGIGTLTAAVSAAFLQQEVSMRRAFQAVRGKIGRLIGASLLSSLLVGLGFLAGIPLFIAGGLAGAFSSAGGIALKIVTVLMFLAGVIASVAGAFYFLVSYLLISEVVVLENLGATTSLRRSRELMRRKTDRNFVDHNITKASIILFITFALSAVVSVAFGIITAMSRTHVAYSPFGPLQLLQGVLTMTVQAAVAPVGRIAMILFYYDIRIRKEGFDLEVLATALGRQP